MQAVCCHEFNHVAQTAVFIEKGESAFETPVLRDVGMNEREVNDL